MGVAIWLLAVAIAVPNRAVLLWAVRELPLYLDGTFSDPPERVMLLEALERMREDPADPEIERLLRASAAIDPNGEATYRLALLAADAGQEAEAIAGLERWLEIDRTDPRAWIELARLYRAAGRGAEARALLERGRAFFAGEAELQRPRPIPEVGVRFNRKAQEIHAAFVEALAEIDAELAGS